MIVYKWSVEKHDNLSYDMQQSVFLQSSVTHKLKKNHTIWNLPLELEQK